MVTLTIISLSKIDGRIFGMVVMHLAICVQMFTQISTENHSIRTGMANTCVRSALITVIRDSLKLWHTNRFSHCLFNAIRNPFSTQAQILPTNAFSIAVLRLKFRYRRNFDRTRKLKILWIFWKFSYFRRETCAFSNDEKCLWKNIKMANNDSVPHGFEPLCYGIRKLIWNREKLFFGDFAISTVPNTPP